MYFDTWNTYFLKKFRYRTIISGYKFKWWLWTLILLVSNKADVEGLNKNYIFLYLYFPMLMSDVGRQLKNGLQKMRISNQISWINNKKNVDNNMQPWCSEITGWFSLHKLHYYYRQVFFYSSGPVKIRNVSKLK